MIAHFIEASLEVMSELVQFSEVWIFHALHLEYLIQSLLWFQLEFLIKGKRQSNDEWNFKDIIS